MHFWPRIIRLWAAELVKAITSLHYRDIIIKVKWQKFYEKNNPKNIFKKLVFEDCLVGTDLRLNIFYKKSMKNIFKKIVFLR